MTEAMDKQERSKVEQLKFDAHRAIGAAERAWHGYACELDVGPERTYAFEVYERIRTATRRFHD